MQSYVTGSRAAGVPDEQIKSSLLASGWAEADVVGALSGAAVPTPHAGVQVSSTGRRFANYFIDGIILYVLYFVIIAGILLNTSGDEQAMATFSGLSPLFFIVALVGYFLIFEGIWQRSPAKFITGTKVVMRDGSKPDFMHILGRSFARLIPFEPFSFLGGAPGWHDTLSKTLVVPKDYTPGQVQHIDLGKKSKNTAVIVIVGLVVTLAVAGIIAAVILVSLNSARSKARDARRVSDALQVQNSLEIYYNDHQSYPNNLYDLVEDGWLIEVPVAPLPVDGACTMEMNEYTYSSSGPEYMFTFCLGSASGGYQEGLNTLSSTDYLDNFTN